MSKKTTQISQGAELAKEQLAIKGARPLIKLDEMEKGNRSQRRTAAKQKRRKP